MRAPCRTRSNPLELLVVLTAGVAAALFFSTHDPAVNAPAVPVPAQGVSHSPLNPHRARRAGAYDTGLGIVIVSAPSPRTEADRVAP